jgi:hypothetical protein
VAGVSVQVKDFLKARRDRALGSILGHAERELYSQLTHEQQQNLRQATIDALNSYHDSVLDLVKSENGTVRNEEVLNLLTRVDRHLKQRES